MQFLDDDSFAILETNIEEEDNILKLVVIDEKHYKLVNRNDLSGEEIENYRKLSNDWTDI
ncbi:MAG: hypothetical protein GY749_03840 [Desulfobacteraceae bacterium]|nr:hypothetical protein [Desulfobacteraceae bacterium]